MFPPINHFWLCGSSGWAQTHGMIEIHRHSDKDAEENELQYETTNDDVCAESCTAGISFRQYTAALETCQPDYVYPRIGLHASSRKGFRSLTSKYHEQ